MPSPGTRGNSAPREDLPVELLKLADGVDQDVDPLHNAPVAAHGPVPELAVARPGSPLRTPRFRLEGDVVPQLVVQLPVDAVPVDEQSQPDPPLGRL